MTTKIKWGSEWLRSLPSRRPPTQVQQLRRAQLRAELEAIRQQACAPLSAGDLAEIHERITSRSRGGRWWPLGD